jgi:hypothetical protein
MNLKKYKRFFAFGCSFTWYHWPTWADAIAREIPETYNYGRPASGNFYIFASIIEANIKHKFNEDDLIIVMWSSIDREDRYINNKWEAKGSVYHSIDDFYDKEFVKKYVDPRGCFIRDASTMVAVSSLLKGLDYHYLSMVPFTNTESYKNTYKAEDDLREFYKDTLKTIKPSVLEVIYNFNWGTRKNIKRKDNGREYTDLHPTPNMHVEYLQRIFPDLKLSDETIEFMDNEDKMVLSTEYFDPSKYTFSRPYIDRL